MARLWCGRPDSHVICSSVTTQIWLTPPLVIYLTERVVRWLWPSVRSADLVDVHLLPGKERVICLRVRKPAAFHYS